MVKIYKQPFAHDGDAVAIPDASQPDGKMSSADGWTPDYQLPKTDPNYKPVGRQEMNGVFKEVTEALGQIQQFGFADWQNITGGWPIGANVRHGGSYWQSLANANTEEPVSGAFWRELLFNNLVPASETVRGVIHLATTAEAQALVNDMHALTPKKLADSFKGSNQTLSENGYQKLPGGMIIQWGYVASAASGANTVSLPVSFPNAIFSVSPGEIAAMAVTAQVAWNKGASTLTTLALFAGNTEAGTPVGGFPFSWLAIGW